jgi:hypothetical protein
MHELHASLKELFSVFVLCAVVVGCGPDRSEFTATKRIDEKVTEAELKAFVRVIRSLPDEKIPEIPLVFAPPPDWNQARTLPVGELVNEEQNLIDERWSAEWLARYFEKNRRLARALRREQMTTEQFAGLTLAVGVALARNTLQDDRNLDKVLQKGYAAVKRLKSDSRPFSSLGREGRHHILRQAAWITRIDRIERLTQVPPENIAIVREHLDMLQPMFPAEFGINPLAAVVDRLDEQGMPFEEMVESGSDAEIEWDAHDVDVGTDVADEEFRKAEETTGTASSGFSPTN